MILDAPKTQEDVERLKHQFDKWGHLGAGLWAFGMIFIAILCPALPFIVPRHRLPGPLQPFWSAFPLATVLGLGFIAIFLVSPLARKARASIPLSHAIYAYYHAITAYSQWRAEDDKRQLTRAAHFVKHAEAYLSAVPEFRELKEEVLRAAEEQGCG